MIPQSPIQINLYNTFSDYNLFVGHFKPANLILLYEDINTVEESVAETRISIEDIKILYSNNKLHAGIDYLTKWIDYLQDFLNINNRLKKSQDVAAVLYKSHRHFYLSDLSVIFQAILRSEYGRFYGSVDSQTIVTSFAEYNVSRFTAYQRAKQAVDAMMSKKYDEIKGTLRNQIWNELEESGLENKERYREVEKILAVRLPEVLAIEEAKLMKESSKLKSAQE